MQIDTFANRLRKALSMNNMSQTELSNKTKIDKSLISNYLSGNYKAKQDNLYILAKALNVSEVWLMGFDVPYNNDKQPTSDNKLDETDILYDKYKDFIPEKDKNIIRAIIEETKKEIDRERGED